MDSEEALRLLTKALKTFWAVDALSQIPLKEATGGQNAHEFAAVSSSTTSRDLPVPCSMIPSAGGPGIDLLALLPMVSRAALILGYMHLDGEGTKADPGEACRMFKLSAGCGSNEGESVLGW